LGNSTPTKAKPRLFRLRRSQFLSAKWAGIEALCRATYQHGHALSLHRHLSADGAGRAAPRGVETEETCSLAQPLVQSLRAARLLHGRESCGTQTEKASDGF
jgi:hypothetical protein